MPSSLSVFRAISVVLALAVATVVPVLVPPAAASASDGGGGPVPYGYDPLSSVVVARSAHETKFANPDGTETSELSAGLLNYQTDAGQWQAIDNTVHPDGSSASLTNTANSWRVHFDDTTTGVLFDTAAGSVAMAPVGAQDRDPAVGATSDSVQYTGTWPDADLGYRVTPEGVKESVLIKSRNAPTSYDFTIRTGTAEHVRAGLGSDGTPLSTGADDSVTLPGNLAPVVRLGAPTVLRSDGEPVEGAGAKLIATSGHVTLSLDPVWLAAQPDSAFPINLDPPLQTAANSSGSYKSDGTSCSGSGCVGIQVGNARDNGDAYWRTVAHFPYESLFGDQVLDVKLLNAWEGGTKNAYGLRVFWASAYSYAGAVGHPTVLASGDLGTSQVPLTSSTLTSTYSSWIANRTPSGALGFAGTESPGTYTYQIFAFNLWINYNRPPSETGASFNSPAHVCTSRILVDNTKSFALQGKMSDPDTGAQIRGVFEIWNTAHTALLKSAVTSAAVSSGQYAKASYPPLYLANGTLFDWRVKPIDEHSFAGGYSGWCQGQITYPPPSTPASLRVTSPKLAACPTPGNPTSMRGLQPITTQETIADPDNKQVFATLQVAKTSDKSSLFTVKSSVITPATAGTAVTTTVPLSTVQSQLPDGTAFSWRVQTTQSAAPSLSSAWTGWCDAIIDNSGPDTPSASTDLHYLGVDGHVTFTDADPSVVAYTWSQTSNLPTSQPGCGTVTNGYSTLCKPTSGTDGWNTATITAPNQSEVTVYFEAFDTAGNSSGTTEAVFDIRTGQLLHAWVTDTKLPDDPDGDAPHLADWPGAAQTADLTLSDPTNGWDPNGLYVGPGLSFGGTNAAQSATGTQVVDTSASFTVLAWIKQNAAGGTQTIVSGSGTSAPSYTLGTDATDHLQFCVETSTAGGAANGDCATSTTTPANTWTLVIGTWNAHSGQLLLYAADQLIGHTTRATSPSDSGPVAFGATTTEGAISNGWQGGIADPAVFDDALSQDQIEQLNSCGLAADPNASCPGN